MPHRAWTVSALGLTGMGMVSAPAPVPTRLRLFLELQQVWADEAFLRREIAWVDWVRDRSEAQVQLILVAESAGGGGSIYTIRFVGLGDFSGIDDRVILASPPAATPDSVRRGLARRIALGLARYAARLPQAESLELKVREDGGAAPTPTRADPWKGWVHRLQANGYFSGESQTSSSNTSANASSSMVTADDFIRIAGGGNWNRSRFELEDQVLRSSAESYNASAVMAKALSNQWTWGLMAGAARSSRSNLSSQIRLAPALEYNLWKYSESSQRQMTFLYRLGLRRTVYMEETIFGKTIETVGDNGATIALDLNQPWGTVSASLGGNALLGDWSKNSVGLSGSVDLRVAKGLSLNLYASYSRVRDQIALPRSGATDDEVLLRLKELATAYRFYLSLGVSYTFGSIFNSAVNSRFRAMGGGSF